MKSYGAERNLVHGSTIAASATQVSESGHPQFASLQVGEMGSANVASVFLDLSGFTSRTFWESPQDSARLAHAVLSGFASVVRSLGGHVLGLRGDGLFASFGPSHDAISVSVALAAAAASLHAVESDLNPRLSAVGISPVIARAGVDFGELVFVRSGDETSSEVNVVGFSANFAAKCEKFANAWEIVVGEGAASVLPSRISLTSRDGSPKLFQHEGNRRSYHYYDFSWRKMLSEVEGLIQDVDGLPLENIPVRSAA